METNPPLLLPDPLKLVEASLTGLFAFDIGFELKLPQITELLSSHTRDPIRYSFISLTIERDHQPVCLALFQKRFELGGKEREFQVYVTFYDVGSMSLEFTCSITENIEALPALLNEIHQSVAIHAVATEVARALFNIIKPAIAKPGFFKSPSIYTVVNIAKLSRRVDARTIVSELGKPIANALKLSDEPIGQMEITRTLTPHFTYSDNDVVFASSKVAVFFDETASEVIDIFELANVQSLQLRFIDARLDATLQLLYEENEKRLPLWRKLLPLFETQFQRLNTIHLDTTIIVERVEQSYKIAADSYVMDIHELAVQKMFLHSVSRGVDRKLEVIRDVMSDLRTKSQNTRMEILEWIVILLIALEILAATLRMT